MIRVLEAVAYVMAHWVVIAIGAAIASGAGCLILWAVVSISGCGEEKRSVPDWSEVADQPSGE